MAEFMDDFPKAAGASSDELRPHPEHTRGAASGLRALGQEADPAQARVVPALPRHLPPPLQRLRASSVQSRPPQPRPPLHAVRQRLAFHHLDCQTCASLTLM